MRQSESQARRGIQRLTRVGPVRGGDRRRLRGRLPDVEVRGGCGDAIAPPETRGGRGRTSDAWHARLSERGTPRSGRTRPRRVGDNRLRGSRRDRGIRSRCPSLGCSRGIPGRAAAACVAEGVAAARVQQAWEGGVCSRLAGAANARPFQASPEPRPDVSLHMTAGAAGCSSEPSREAGLRHAVGPWRWSGRTGIESAVKGQAMTDAASEPHRSGAGARTASRRIDSAIRCPIQSTW